METLPKDVRMKIGLKLSPKNLIHFCLTEKKQYLEIYNSNEFWRNKLLKNYPEEFLDFYQKGVPVTNPKEVYIKRFTEVTKLIESYMDDFIHATVGKSFKDYLNEKYREKYFKCVLDYYEFWEETYDSWKITHENNTFWDYDELPYGLNQTDMYDIIPERNYYNEKDKENPFWLIKELMTKMILLEREYFYKKQAMKYIKKTE